MAVNINHATDTITASSGTLNLPNFSGGGGLTHFVESESTAAPNATIPVDAFTATDASYTNIDVALVAKGTGATLAQVPDGTTAGGNKRGQKATDFQKERNTAIQVASGGWSTIGGGYGNRASADTSVVAGGITNNATGGSAVVVGGDSNTAGALYASVGGGNGNNASGTRATIAGGATNAASSNYSFVGGGQSNTASTNTHATVCGGNTNTASGPNSFVGGGNTNTASGTNATVLGGTTNSATTSSATVLGGEGNTANSVSSTVVGGSFGITRNIQGYCVFPSSYGPIDYVGGVTQSALLLLARQTTDATATILTSNSSGASILNQVTLPNNSAYSFSGEVIAGVTGAGNSARWTINGAIKRGANAASTVMVGTPTVTMTHFDAGAAAWVVAVTANTTLGCITVTVTGAAATTIRWVCTINTTEMTY
jgi:hypothetical protein